MFLALIHVYGVLNLGKTFYEILVLSTSQITGTPLYAVRRFQLNLWVHPIPTVTHFANMTERIIPLAWFEHVSKKHVIIRFFMNYRWH